MCMPGLVRALRIAVAAILPLSIGAVALGSPDAARAEQAVPAFDALLAHRVALKPELVGVHPRVFVTAGELATLRARAHNDRHRRPGARHDLHL